MLEYKIHSNVASNDHLILIHGMGGNSNIFYRQIKDYSKHFNVITLHLPGHGNSPSLESYTDGFSYTVVAQEIVKTMDHLNIERAHFLGVSLGTVILHHLLKERPERVQSVILAATITRFTFISKFLFQIGKMIKSITPHTWIYKLFAHIIMPKPNHKKSRDIFIREAQKMRREDFIGWFKTFGKVKTSYDEVIKHAKDIPKLYISGREDHLFLNSVKEDIKKDKNAVMRIIEKCGHVCNIEGYQKFNDITLDFFKTHSRKIEQIS
ncbi:alpha/beta fold hydrolase [Thalassobacillus sp. CUG 92003]|uniref:alpha/beta fold hydrolase n=1 Tax=Thalassobacillus sp. CUG 92003 TaxID=2736641 RepID=UPI002102905E|nr:alpha/beta hydrolase [Thalassobacillus sp. CUG 92003]